MKSIKSLSLVLFTLIFCSLTLTSCAHLQPKIQSSTRDLSQDSSLNLLYYWSQFIGNNQISFRTIVSAPDCPDILIDGEAHPMILRSELFNEVNLKICEFRAPQSTHSAKIADTELPVVPRELTRIVAFGDTGCRMKKLGPLNIIQNCKKPSKWPFEKMVNSAALKKVDLAIHLGDYNYRDINCPKNNSKCAGLDSKNTWKSWEQDVLKPLQSLLKITPFIFVRGNHENCAKFGTGWFKFFAAEIYDQKDKCTETTPTFDVKIDNIDFVNIDSTSEAHQKTEIFRLEKKYPLDYLWLLTHRPFLAASEDVNLKKAPRFNDNMNQPGAVQLSMAGHTHIGSFVSFKNNKPPELILGNGGVKIDIFTNGPYEGEDVNVNTLRDYGYATFERINAHAWQLLMLDKKQKVRIKCVLIQSPEKKTDLSCN